MLKPGAYRHAAPSLNHRPIECGKRMVANMKMYELEASVEELEQSAFQRADQEEVTLVTVPRRRSRAL